MRLEAKARVSGDDWDYEIATFKRNWAKLSRPSTVSLHSRATPDQATFLVPVVVE